METLSLKVACMGLSPSSLRFDFLRHTSKVELSVIGRMQSPGPSLLAIISIQGVITVAKCSRRLFEAKNFNHKGMQNLQSKPSLLYPPKPAGHESDLQNFVGFL